MRDDRQPRPAITDFRGDFEQLAEVIQRSWAENSERPLLYTANILRSTFQYPGSSFDLAPSVYSGADLIAFIAGFPRSVRLNGCAMRLVLTSFLTAAAEWKRAGYGLTVWGELAKRAQAAGYDGSISFCVEGDDMNRMIPLLGRLFHLDVQRVFSIGFLGRFIGRSAGEPTPAVSEQDIALFLELTSELPSRTPLARTWTFDEAAWQCRGREGALTVVAEYDGRRGMLTGSIMDVASTPPARVALLDDLLWGNLEMAEQTGLVRRFLRAAGSRGAQTASCPVLGYAPIEALTAAGFRPTKRVLHMYLTLWNREMPKPLPSLYVDIF